MEDLNFIGLSEEEVKSSRERFGKNISESESEGHLWQIIKDVISEPLFVILICAAIIYSLLGEYSEGIIMVVALMIVSGISLYQENRSRSAVNELKKLSSPHAKVIRGGITLEILSEEIVMNDLIVVEDGNLIPADATVLEVHDFTVNESMVTGESLPVFKDLSDKGNKLFKGTMVMTGSCIARVSAISNQTVLGKIGESLKNISVEKTPLQLQIKSFVRSMMSFGVIVFFIVWAINYYLSKSILHGLLHGLTLAMSVVPEEIPVAFSTFMALGAYRLYKRKVIVRNPLTVETLGSATVICTDKTGTITENEMQLAAIYDFKENKIHDYTNGLQNFNTVLEYAMWASETNPFDMMEKSIHNTYVSTAETDEREKYSMHHEYPLSGKPPFMTHVFKNKESDHIIACKGGVESILSQSKLSDDEKKNILSKTNEFALKGFRVLAVAKSHHNIEALPASQHDFEFDFLGLIAFYDPPKKNMQHILQQFYRAGIKVKIITGDYPETTLAIASQINFKDTENILTGSDVMTMSEKLLREKVGSVNIFARMFPEAKLKVIEALKANGEVVAMTGDGVNDGPALKASQIGIAMGKRGSEIAKSAASLIIIDDDLSHMVDAIALGRHIYENLKKAIRYIISIHIPIILIVTAPLLLFWKFSDFFSPVHVIFLELIMGPTCSVIFENEPIEENTMIKNPRKMNSTLFSWHELSISLIQGLIISLACLGLGYFYLFHDYSETTVRTIIFSTLIFSNLFLTLVNRSFYYSIFKTIKNKNRLLPIMLFASLIILFLSLYFEPVREIFRFEELHVNDLLVSLASAFVGVIWIEFWKIGIRKKMQ